MLVCRICGWENSVTAAFCTNCGAGLARGRAADAEDNPREGASSSPEPAPPAAGDTEEGLALPKLSAPPEPRRESAPTMLDFRVPATMTEMAEVLLGAEAVEPVTDEHPKTDPEVPVAQTSSAAPVDLGAVARALRAEAGMSTPPGEVEARDEGEAGAGEADDEARVLLTPPTPQPERPETIDVDPIDESGDGFEDLRDDDEPDALADAIEALSTGSDGVDSAEHSPGVFDDEPDLQEDLHEIDQDELHSLAGEDSGGSLLDTGELGELAVEEPRPVPPPIPEVTARFVLRPLSENVARSKLVPIGDDAVTIGRDGADVVFDSDDCLSPCHARFVVDEEGLYVDDLDSLNGVWLRVRDEVVVHVGDTVLFGRQVLRVDAMAPRPNGEAPDDGTRRIGAPAGDLRFRLVQMGDDGQPVDVYHLAADGCRVGRHIADLVFTEDNFMSGTHALLRPTGDGVQVRDLSSRNGSWVRVDGRQRLDAGDAVMLGRTVWRVSASVD